MANMFKTAMLFAFLSSLLLIIGGMLGGRTGLIVALGFALLMNFGSYWFADKVVLKMYRAQEVGSEHPLSKLVARLAGRAQLPMPRVYVIPSDSPNAFATGRNPQHAAVAATQGILRILHEDELEGVMAHELAHVKHRDILISTIAATIGSAIIMLSRFALFFGGGRDRQANPIALIAMMILAPLAAMLIQAAISRAREFAADRGGAEIAGNPDGLASALRRIESAARQTPLDANPATAHMFIVKPFSGRGVVSLFSTHPPTEERIARLLGR